MLIPRQTKSISWSAPADVRAAAADMNFLDYLKAVAQGSLPNSPAIELLGMRLRNFGDGNAEVSFSPDEHHLNFAGAVHGGVISAVLDSCIGYAVNAALKPEETFVTAQLNVQFVKGVKAGEATLKARAELRHRGGRVAIAEAILEDASGALRATATATCLIMKRVTA